MANLFGFVDETGVLQHDPNQRLFGLGLLKLAATAPLYEELVLLKSKILNELPRMEKPFEFKFNGVNRTNYKYYQALIELYFSFPQAAFCALVIDKQHPKFQIEKYYKDVWEAYISYSKLLINKSTSSKDEICVLADFLGKPKSSMKYYEVELARPSKSNRIYNACMLESHAALFIQVVDVLVGCVVYNFRLHVQPDHKPNDFKKALVELVQHKLGMDSLAKKMTRKEPNYFSVWPFRME